VKRRDTKREIAVLEKQFLPVVRSYLSAGERVHPDVICQYENRLEVKLYHLLNLYLRLDPSWLHHARWLDGLEAFVWSRTSIYLQGECELRWGHAADVTGALVREPFKVVLGIRKRKHLVYIIRLGAGEDQRCYANRGSGINWRQTG
jgi:hypothetical protein